MPLDILVNTPQDVKTLPDSELAGLCSELRGFLIKNVSKTGGHLASNLGIVELTVAMHRVFDTEKDRVVFDVGHQSYVHKLLTGRRGRFKTLRKLGGLSGFTKPSESVHDAAIAGHASTSISAALGMARARTLTGNDYSVLAVIGDGALTGGLAFEALSDAGESGEPLIIVLNDNGMSITDNVGGIARYLSRRRIKPSYAAFKKHYKRIMEILPGGRRIYKFTHGVKTAIKRAVLNCSMFEEMGLEYIGPVDGHDVKRLVEALTWARGLKVPVVVHVITQKGRGYNPAVQSPEDYHGVAPFDYRTGILQNGGATFSTVFGKELTRIAGENPKICAITASMTTGTGLTGFSERYQNRFFDVGIAEGHAVTMAAGMAAQGAIPVFAVYSTFLQRSYDMIIHDCAISGLHVLFAIDRAGLVAGDGETHQGVFDAAYLSTIPGLTVMCPASFAELRDMLRYAIDEVTGPVALRYPRGGEGAYKDGGTRSAVCVREGCDFTIVTYGTSVNTALETAAALKKEGISVEIIKLGTINPIDFESVEGSVRKTGNLLVLEESVFCGSVGQRISAHLLCDNFAPESVILLNVGERFVPCGEIDELRRLCGLDTESVCKKIRNALRTSRAGKSKEKCHGQNTA